MADFNKFYGTQEINEKFFLSLEKLEKNISQLKNVYSEELGILPDGSYHALTLAFKTEDKFDKMLWSHILETAYQAEKKSAGGALVSIKSFCLFGKWLLLNKDFSKKQVNDFLESFLKDCKTNSSVIAEIDLFKSIESEFSKSLIEIAKQTLTLNGVGSNITIEKNSSFHYEIELKNGFTFPVKTIGAFLDKNIFEWKRSECKVLLVDGFIETIGEIETLIHQLSKTKEKLLIISQGFEQEVQSFLLANKRRGIIDVCLVTVEAGMESMNLMNDIATASGSELISVVNGDLVSLVKLEGLTILPKVNVMSSMLTFNQKNTKTAVNVRIQDLIKKKNEMANSDDIYNFSEFYLKRIRNLMGQAVVIKLPEFSKTQLINEKTQLDIILRQCRSLLDFGLVDTNNVNLEYGLAAIKKELPEKISHLSFAVGIWMAVKKAMEVLTVSGAVVLD